MKELNYLFILLLSLITPSALSHPGHDHSHWLSNPIHWLTLAALTTFIFAILIYLRRRKLSSSR